DQEAGEIGRHHQAQQPAGVSLDHAAHAEQRAEEPVAREQQRDAEQQRMADLAMESLASKFG
ncbi:MAG: hypothetical protein IE917_17090, partial [Betaproteobacteria bacterium]|nr:hypothetical protein [Betaproteobacteria bacterium]